MLPRSSHPLRLGALALVGLGAACGADDHELGFSVDFASDTLRARAVLVEASLRRGGCAGELVFSTDITRASEGRAPGKLAKGRYGFSARARDAGCVWFAEGCSEATLPSDTSLTVVISEMKTPELDTSCLGADAGVRAMDASSASDLDANGNGDAMSPSGGGFDPAAPKCDALEPALVACYDFDGTLADATASHNDASGASVSFEPGLSGQALRPSARPIVVADDGSLDFSGPFTIEMWLRADGLVNLDGETNEISLLLDKDQQYDVGFDTSGALRMEVYSGVGDANEGFASSSSVRVGAFTYVAFAYDGARAHFYQDGDDVGSVALDVAPFTGNGGTMHIGSGSPNTTRPFDGLIDALRIWNEVRDPAAICAAAGRSFHGQRCR